MLAERTRSLALVSRRRQGLQEQEKSVLHEELTEKIIECAMEVHKRLGPGLLESNYQAAFALELTHRGIPFVREPQYSVEYRGAIIGHHRPDFVIDGRVVVEIKSVATYDPVFASQVITYMRLTGSSVGLLLNFNRPLMKDGIKRFVL